MVKYYVLYRWGHIGKITLALCNYTSAFPGYVLGTKNEFKINALTAKLEHEIKRNGNLCDYWLEEEVPSWVINGYNATRIS